MVEGDNCGLKPSQTRENANWGIYHKNSVTDVPVKIDFYSRCGDQNTYALARPPSVLIAWLSLERVCACRPPGSMVARACVCVLTEAGLLVPPVNSTARESIPSTHLTSTACEQRESVLPRATRCYRLPTEQPNRCFK